MQISRIFSVSGIFWAAAIFASSVLGSPIAMPEVGGVVDSRSRINHPGVHDNGPIQKIDYRGNGENWPSIEQWRTWEDLVELNMPIMGWGCDWMGRHSSTHEEIEHILGAIQQEANRSGVDRRLILAVIMQESNGCVRVPTTISPDGVLNPGLMQAHNGPGSCDKNGVQTDPCPANEIYQMVQDGTSGTAGPEGFGLAQLINKAADEGHYGAQAIYWAVKFYNSGVYTIRGDLRASGATSSYPSDIANRLLGCVDIN